VLHVQGPGAAIRGEYACDTNPRHVDKRPIPVLSRLQPGRDAAARRLADAQRTLPIHTESAKPFHEDQP